MQLQVVSPDRYLYGGLIFLVGHSALSTWAIASNGDFGRVSVSNHSTCRESVMSIISGAYQGLVDKAALEKLTPVQRTWRGKLVAWNVPWEIARIEDDSVRAIAELAFWQYSR